MPKLPPVSGPGEPSASPPTPKGCGENEGGFSSHEANVFACERCLLAACDVLDFDIAELWAMVGEEPRVLHVFGKKATIESYSASLLGVWSAKTLETRHSLSPSLCRAAMAESGPVWLTSADPDTTPLHEDIPLNTAVALPISSEHLRKDVVAVFFSCADVPRSKAAIELLRYLSRAAAVASAAAFPADDGSMRGPNDLGGAYAHSTPAAGSPMRPSPGVSPLPVSPPVPSSPPVLGTAAAAAEGGRGDVVSGGQQRVCDLMTLPEEANEGRAASAAEDWKEEVVGSGDTAKETAEEVAAMATAAALEAAAAAKRAAATATAAAGAGGRASADGGAASGTGGAGGGGGGIGISQRRLSLELRRASLEALAAAPVELDVPWSELSDLEFLVNGSRCTIYTARYRGVNVVVKLLNKAVPDPDIVRGELELEMDMLRKLRHSNIVRLVGAGTRPERFLLIARLDGGTLAQRCGNALAIRDRRGQFRRAKPFTYVELLRCARQLAEALRYMHESAIPGYILIHRDLKPDNIAFDIAPDGSPVLKLIDLGLAKQVQRGATDDEVYQLTGETGSLRYMAPEVARAEPYNEKADVYGFGLILWEMAAMKKPFEGLGRSSFFELVVDDATRMRPPINKKWPKPFVELLQQCWAADPRQRARLDDVSTRLKAMLGEAEAAAAAGAEHHSRRSRLAKFFKGEGSDSM